MGERALTGPGQAACAVFDCVLFNGETDVLAIRMHELDAVVDHFVIVEATLTHSGLERAIAFDPSDPRVTPFAAKVRHVIVADLPETDDPWQREIFQRNALMRGIPDARTDDLVLVSDVDEIPRASVVARIRTDQDHDVFGFELRVYYFFVNYRNTGGPYAAITWAIAARRKRLDDIDPNALRYAVRERRVAAQIIPDAGWHFSYLMDDEAVRRKIVAFAHQELNNEAFLRSIDIASIVRKGADLFGRDGHVWKLTGDDDLPAWLTSNRRSFARYWAATSLSDRIAAWLRPRPPSAQARPPPEPPIVICAYLFDGEQAEVRSKFGLGPSHTPAMPFHFFQDTARIGPERAFQHCWRQFPDRDVVIVHSDMAPLPGEPPDAWYKALCHHRDALPRAGMLACNLFYPRADPAAPRRVQCAGGTFVDGVASYLHGDVPADVPEAALTQVRPVDWVTFGGVLIRRDVIRACGDFDDRYQWAYSMDVDYCLEARLRGFRLVQVPVGLQHEENRTTNAVWVDAPELREHVDGNIALLRDKWRPLLPALPSESAIGRPV